MIPFLLAGAGGLGLIGGGLAAFSGATARKIEKAVPRDGDLIEVDGQTVWNRKSDGGFPDIAELKRRVRDIAQPGRSLGHTDRVD